jgi:hypothetical protein
MKRSILIWAVLIVFSCLWAQAKDDWSYRGEVTAKGTRSQGFIGHLLYLEKEVPPKIGRVVTPIGEYEFILSPYLWGRRGWLRVETASPLAASSAAFDASSRSHWYGGGKRPGTPKSWVYLPQRHSWVDPDYFQQFLDSELPATSQ